MQNLIIMVSDYGCKTDRTDSYKGSPVYFLPLLSVNSIFSFQFWIKIMNFGIGVRIMNAYN